MVERALNETNWARWLGWGAAAGIVAGAAFGAVTMWFAASTGDPAKGPLLMISTIVQGEEAMRTGTASVGVGLAVHMVLSALFGVLFAVLVSRVKGDALLAWSGPLYGAVLYLLTFKVLSPVAFPVFEMANQPFELVVHVVFGTLLSLILLGVSGRGANSSVEHRAAPARTAATSA